MKLMLKKKKLSISKRRRRLLTSRLSVFLIFRYVFRIFAWGRYWRRRLWRLVASRPPLFFSLLKSLEITLNMHFCLDFSFVMTGVHGIWRYPFLFIPSCFVFCFSPPFIFDAFPLLVFFSASMASQGVSFITVSNLFTFFFLLPLFFLMFSPFY